MRNGEDVAILTIGHTGNYAVEDVEIKTAAIDPEGDSLTYAVQAAGIAAAKSKGVYQNNGDRRRGYRKAKDKVLKLHKKGHSPTAIARECGVARSTVYEYLKTP